MDEIPFDAQHRFMATLNQVPYEQKVVLVKGAPERFERCVGCKWAEMAKYLSIRNIG